MKEKSKKRELTEEELIKNTLFYQCCKLRDSVVKLGEVVAEELKNTIKSIIKTIKRKGEKK